MSQSVPRPDDVISSAQKVCPMCGEPIAGEPIFVDRLKPSIQLLAQCRPWILFVCIAVGAISLMEFMQFAYQSTYRLPSGQLYRETELAGLDLLSHLLRSVGCAAVCYTLSGLAKTIRRVTGSDLANPRQLFVAQKAFWTVLGVFVALLVIYSVSYTGYIWYLATRPSLYQP